MTLVIKSLGVSAPAGAKKLYRDALVANGTLLLYDFSNKGTLQNFSLAEQAPILDLARESSEALNVFNIGRVQNTGGSYALTPGKGFSPIGTGVGAGKGLIFTGTLLQYLASKQPKSVLIFWARVAEGTFTGSEMIRSYGGEPVDYSYPSIRANITSTGTTDSTVVSFGGANTTGKDMSVPSKSLMQVALEFQGVGLPVKIYKNGTYMGLSSANATGFSAGATNLSFGNVQGSTLTKAAIYRVIVEDLAVSGRNAQDVINKDYNYVNAIGDFNGIPVRPFVNTY